MVIITKVAPSTKLLPKWQAYKNNNYDNYHYYKSDRQIRITMIIMTIIITNVAGKVPVAPFISEVQSEDVGLCIQVPVINY